MFVMRYVKHNGRCVCVVDEGAEVLLVGHRLSPVSRHDLADTRQEKSLQVIGEIAH